MKIEKISDNIIKITISLSDLKEREIDLNSVNYDSAAAQKLFWDMMDKAEEEFGFDVSDSQMLIESIPDAVDGFVITITRLDGDSNFEAIHSYILNRYPMTRAKPRKRSRRVFSAGLIYRFDSIEDVSALGKRLSGVKIGDSTLFEYNGKYYVKLAKNNVTLKELRIFEAGINEFGKKISNTGFIDGILNEYGTVIIKSNALQTLSSSF